MKTRLADEGKPFIASHRTMAVGWTLLRVVAALGFMHHGTSKLFDFPPFMMPGPLPLLGLVAGLLELIGGSLLLVGLFTRPVAFVLSGQMAVAYWVYHAPNGFFPSENHGETAMLYSFIFLFLAAAGAGPWSLDGRLRVNRVKHQTGSLG